MNIYGVVEHIQQILNQCGDPIELLPTGDYMQNENGQYSIELEEVFLKRENNVFTLPAPNPISAKDTDECFVITRIRIGRTMMDDYSKGYPFSDEEVLNVLKEKEDLFGYYK
jgi:hypothetical protein